MKKAIIVLTILLIPALSLQANFRIGAKAGVNLAKATFSTEDLKTENFTGFQVGPIVEFTGLAGFGLDAAILYSQHGLKSTELDYEEKVGTLDIPVNLKMKFSLMDLIGCYLTAGPYISFKLEDKVFSSSGKIQEQWKSKNFGAGLNFGGGVELMKNLQIGVNYQLALNDDYSNFSLDDLKDYKAKSRIWSITAAYFF